MDKNEPPTSYNHQGYGYGAPQAPPAYDQGNPAYPPQQQQQFLQQPQQQYPNVVIHQPVVAAPGTLSAPPPDHMGSAIFVTLCCFWPTGIVAIMKANDAKNAWLRGDAGGAHAAAASAKTFVNVSIIAGVCSLVFLAIFIGVYVGVVLKNLNDINNDYSYDD